MRKVYTLLLAVIVAVAANAQIATPGLNIPVKKSTFTAPLKQAKNAPGEMLVSYPELDATYFGAEGLNGAHLWFLQTDTLGICHFTNSNGVNYTRPFVYSMAQTFDLNSYFYDDVVPEGEVSLRSTAALNIDSVYLVCNYRRDNDMSPNIKDTLIVSIVTAEPSSYSHYPSIPVSTCFYDYDFDVNTGMQAGAQAFKYVLGAEDVATDDAYSVIELPIGLTNITSKVWNVAITFKRGYDIGVNDTLPSDFYVIEVTSADNDYYVGADDDIEDLYRCDNMSHGGRIWDYLVEYMTSHNITPYYYPSFFDDEDHFIYGLYLKTSCNDCAIVNVPEMEKTNPTVYPNPATNNFTVDLGNDEKATIQLFNIVGQQVYTETITGTTQVNVANLHSGVYMLKINQNGKVYTTKVVVK